MATIEEAEKIYAQKKLENPNFDTYLIEKFKKEMPDDYIEAMLVEEHGHHIYDKDLYEEAVSLLDWINGSGKGAKWSVDDIARLSGINFNEKAYTKYDFAYWVNMKWSDYCNVFTDPVYYFKISVNDLEDIDFPDCYEADERAYYNAKKRIKYFG